MFQDGNLVAETLRLGYVIFVINFYFFQPEVLNLS